MLISSIALKIYVIDSEAEAGPLWTPASGQPEVKPKKSGPLSPAALGAGTGAHGPYQELFFMQEFLFNGFFFWPHLAACGSSWAGLRTHAAAVTSATAATMLDP